MSRPRLDSAARRDVRIATRWTAAEWSQVREHAEKIGTSRSAFVRRSTLLELSARRRRERGPRPDPALRRDLARIGSNLNQIARALNAGRAVEPGNFAAVVDELGRLLDRVR